MGGLANALRNGDQFATRVNGRRPAVFLDYDATLTPIVDRPEDAVRKRAQRTTACVVSGRDRSVVDEFYENQPKVDWDKGRAVLHLRHALRVDAAGFVSWI